MLMEEQTEWSADKRTPSWLIKVGRGGLRFGQIHVWIPLDPGLLSNSAQQTGPPQPQPSARCPGPGSCVYSIASFFLFLWLPLPVSELDRQDAL